MLPKMDDDPEKDLKIPDIGRLTLDADEQGEQLDAMQGIEIVVDGVLLRDGVPLSYFTEDDTEKYAPMEDEMEVEMLFTEECVKSMMWSTASNLNRAIEKAPFLAPWQRAHLHLHAHAPRFF